ncbi:MAG: hypothetical protein ABI867_04855 [Kofleriaceae bacterium]
MRALILVSICSGTTVWADSAEQHFRAGKRLLAAGQLVEACAELGKSQQIVPKAGTLLNLADCEEKRVRTATARAYFLQAKALAETTGDRARALEADRRLAAIEPALSRLTLVVSPSVAITKLAIYRNDELVDEASWNRPVVLDPDSYVVRATAPGHHPWSQLYKVEPRQHLLVVVEPLVAEVEEPGAPDPVAVAAASPPFARAEARVARKVGVGLLLGMNVQHESGLVGVRAIGATAAPAGQIRAIGALYFSRYADEPMQPSYKTSTYSGSASIEYLWVPRPQFALGGGIGIGVDYDQVTPKVPTADPADARTNDLGTFLTVNVAPMVLRLREGSVEAGVHVAAVIAGDEVTVTAVIAVDWFVW